jgi:glycosyltransferase involved in cell wall biosynthesis
MWNPLRIILVTKGGIKPSGGAQKVAKEWYNELSKKIECHLLTDQDETGRNQNLCKIPQVPLSYLFDTLWFSRKLAQMCKQVKPDIIHLHSHTGFVVFPPKDIPLVVTFHDEPLFIPRDNISKGLAPLYLTILYRFEQLLRFLLLRAKPWVHALSKSVKEDLVTLGIDPGRIQVIPNGFSKSDIQLPTKSKDELLRKLNLPRDSELVVTVGSVSFRKGIHRVLRAAKQIKLLNPKVKFLVIGSMSKFLERAYSNALKAKIADWKLTNVYLLGHIDSTLLHDIMSNADLYLSPTLSEACNLAILEAVGYGIPIVATRVGAVEDLFSNEITMINANPSTSELVRAIRKVLNSRHREYSSIEKCSWQQVTGRILSFYEKILQIKK